MIPFVAKFFTNNIQLTERFEGNWQTLSKQLQWQKGFSLILAFAQSQQAVDLLREQLLKHFKLSVLAPDHYENPLEPVLQQLEALSSEHSTKLIWIDLHHYPSYKNEPLKVFLSRLNERREWLRNHLVCPLILILPDKTEMRKYAPDLWFVRDLTLYLDDTIECRFDNSSRVVKSSECRFDNSSRVVKSSLVRTEEKKFMPAWLTTFLQSVVANPYVLFIVLIAVLLGGLAMFDYNWLTTFLQSFLANTYVQFIALIVGLFGWSLSDYFRQKRKVEEQQAIVNNSLICRLFSSFCFLRAYFRHIIYDHRVFNIKGLRTRGTYTIELEQVFVDLRIAPSTAPNQSHRDLLAVKELQGSQPIWEFLRYGPKMVEDSLLLAIIGSTGCGKTTLLQHIALTFATKKRPRGLPKWVPILLFLRQHVKTILADSPLLAEVVQQHFASQKRYPDLVPPEQWFHRQLQAGQCLVLLDGLDEVADTEERKYISAWIDEQVVNYPRCPIIVTSRPDGYQVAPLARATVVLEVQAFTPPQVRDFIDKWYLATEIMSFGGKDDAGVRLQAKQEAEDLRHRLHTRPTLMALTVNPLLLTMIAMVHRYRGQQLPGKRVELYAEICDVLLGHWREGKGIQDKLTAAQKRVALQPLAAWMMEHSVREIAATTAMEVIRAPLQTVGLAAADIESFFQDIQASSGLFSERETGVWSFAHLTFQEYLAAAHFKEQTLPNDGWHRKVADSWWHETLRLYAAQTDATPIVSACLHTQNIATLTLAADCLEEALKLNAPVRQQVEELLITNLESANPELFKLAAEVKLQQRLRNLRRLDDETTEIDIDFISCAEYQLFLDEKRAQNKFYQPDHWLDYRFVKGSAMQPVVGVRANDAVVFCEWLSGREKVKYRLPKFEEAQSNVPNQLQLATWYYENGIYDLNWSFEKDQKNIEQKLANSSELPVFIGDYQQNINVETNFSEDLKRTITIDCAFGLKNVNRFDRITMIFNKKWVKWVYVLIVIVLGWSILKSLLYGLLGSSILIGVVTIWLYHRTSKQPQFQEILSLDLKIAKYIFERDTNLLGRENMQNILETIKKISGKPLEVLINDLSKILDEITDPKLAQREFFEQITKYIYRGYDQNLQLSWWDKLLYPGRISKRIEERRQRKQMILQLHWWLVITTARQAGQLPAWEGIRIVRDRGDERED